MATEELLLHFWAIADAKSELSLVLVRFRVSSALGRYGYEVRTGPHKERQPETSPNIYEQVAKETRAMLLRAPPGTSASS